MAKAFTGVRVVEFAQVIAGPFAAALLGYLGAEVIKVEPPGAGDQARHLMDDGPLAGSGRSPLYQGLNAGKRSITLDLKRPAAASIVRRLVESADVVVENSRPGVMARLGVDYPSLRRIRPDLIYCAISGYGQEGPRAADPAYDGAIQAASGLMSVTGEAEGPPMKAGFAVVDQSTALTAAFAIASALYRRAQTGEGQYLDVSMLDTALSLLTPQISAYLLEGRVPRRLGNLSLTRRPTADVFPTADGDLQINAVTDTQVRALCTALGRPDLPADPRCATLELQLQHAAEMRAELTAALAASGAREWERTLAAAGVPVARVASLPEVLDDPQVRRRDVIVELPPAEPDAAPPRVVNAGFAAGADGPRPATAAPGLGADTDAVLAELGFSAAEIAGFRQGGVV